MALSHQVRNVTPVTGKARNSTPVTQQPPFEWPANFDVVREIARLSARLGAAEVEIAALIASRPERCSRAEYMRAYRARKKSGS